MSDFRDVRITQIWEAGKFNEAVYQRTGPDGHTYAVQLQYLSHPDELGVLQMARKYLRGQEEVRYGIELEGPADHRRLPAGRSGEDQGTEGQVQALH